MLLRIRVALAAVIAAAFLVLAAAPSPAAPPPKECLVGPLTVGGITIDLFNDGCFP
jgi:hypothetical protein